MERTVRSDGMCIRWIGKKGKMEERKERRRKLGVMESVNYKQNL